jgi:hypothetical protein
MHCPSGRRDTSSNQRTKRDGSDLKLPVSQLANATVSIPTDKDRVSLPGEESILNFQRV